MCGYLNKSKNPKKGFSVVTPSPLTQKQNVQISRMPSHSAGALGDQLGSTVSSHTGLTGKLHVKASNRAANLACGQLGQLGRPVSLIGTTSLRPGCGHPCPWKLFLQMQLLFSESCLHLPRALWRWVSLELQREHAGCKGRPRGRKQFFEVFFLMYAVLHGNTPCFFLNFFSDYSVPVTFQHFINAFRESESLSTPLLC